MKNGTRVGKFSWKKAALALLLGLGLLVVGFVAWASQTNPILPSAEAALAPATLAPAALAPATLEQTDQGASSKVRVEVRPDRLVFRPAAGGTAEAGLVFYPGGRVDFRAYAPYARAVAEEGFLVIIPKMPLNLAVLNAQAAGEIMRAFPEVRAWAVGGHSLGGSMAAQFALDRPDQVRGLVLLASYPAQNTDLSRSALQVVSIYATEDGLATVETVEASRALLPERAEFVAIPGGNHAQFGDYGLQDGDGVATIDRAEQQAQAVQATVALLEKLRAAE